MSDQFKDVAAQEQFATLRNLFLIIEFSSADERGFNNEHFQKVPPEDGNRARVETALSAPRLEREPEMVWDRESRRVPDVAVTCLHRCRSFMSIIDNMFD